MGTGAVFCFTLRIWEMWSIFPIFLQKLVKLTVGNKKIHNCSFGQRKAKISELFFSDLHLLALSRAKF
jgi:hypothetical protein